MTSWIFTELTQLLGEFLRRCFVGLLRPSHPRLGLFLTGEFHFGRCWHGTPSFPLAGWWGLRPSRERAHVVDPHRFIHAHVTLLGTAQDGGRPQPGCQRPCCADLGAADVRHPVSLGITDEHGQGHLIEAARAMGEQLKMWGHPPSIRFAHPRTLWPRRWPGVVRCETLNARGSTSTHRPPCYRSSTTPQWALMVEQGVFLPFPSQPGVNMRSQNASPSFPWWFRIGPNSPTCTLHRAWTESLPVVPARPRPLAGNLDHHSAPSIRSWLTSLEVDIALIDGTFWSADELSSRTQHEVPHPPVSETLNGWTSQEGTRNRLHPHEPHQSDSST